MQFNMKPKILITIFAIILLIGIITAGNTLDNLKGITVPLSPTIAGNTFQANFSFDYLANGVNEDNSPLIIKLNITSENQINYPVWKGDFQMDGIIKKCTWTILGVCLLPRDVSFTCSEIAPLTIINSIDTTTITEIPNGTFYCYNAEGDLKLNEHDRVFLNITSHPALYPGDYNLTAEMFYLNDTTAPIVLILNKNDFENKYYRELSNIEVRANISDGRGIAGVWGVIITPSQNISLEKGDPDGTVYPFTKILPIDILEGSYELRITAKDLSENTESDNTILKIDRTGPNITAIQPKGLIYAEILPVELNVTDAKAGVNTQSVYYRLREMNGTSICPESGIGTWDCYNGGWVKLDLNSTTETYKTSINTTQLGMESGEYWFEAKAEDILGNIGILE